MLEKFVLSLNICLLALISNYHPKSLPLISSAARATSNVLPSSAITTSMFLSTKSSSYS